MASSASWMRVLPHPGASELSREKRWKERHVGTYPFGSDGPFLGVLAKRSIPQTLVRSTRMSAGSGPAFRGTVGTGPYEHEHRGEERSFT